MKDGFAKKKPLDKCLIGWKEWVCLPQFGVAKIRAKIDTGAATSAIHAEGLQILEREGQKYAQFKILPHQNDALEAKVCEAKVVDRRYVMSSNGQREKRYVIETEAVIGAVRFLTEITLTDRTLLNYRMLIGRSSLKRYFLIDPARSHVQKKPQVLVES